MCKLVHDRRRVKIGENLDLNKTYEAQCLDL
jgi:hypothetical protein